jgi:cation transport regulator ChaC
VASTLYFAYGSNLDRAQMADRCPGSVLVSRASVEGWRFRINRRGFATIVPETAATVHGVVWRLSQPDVASLNRYEGVAVRLYVIETLEVLLEGGRRADALTYVATDGEQGTPNPRYIRRIVAAALAHGLPPGYVLELRQWARRGSVAG